MIEVTLIRCAQVDKCLSWVLKLNLTKYVESGGNNYMPYIFYLYIFLSLQLHYF